MAGERSKTIGEIGESIAENFFSKIGWGMPQKGVYFPCLHPKLHVLPSSKGDEKTQHGIDFQINYKSSLESETMNNLLVSVKHSKDTMYPQSATKIFIGYISDLVHSMQCFQRSSHRQDLIKSANQCKKVNDIPVLFYISSKNDKNYNFIEKIATSNFMNKYEVKELYVVDNKKVTFILDVLSYLDNNYKDYEWYFFHPQTGMSYSDPDIIQHSKIMQVEFLTNNFIPFILKKKLGSNETNKFLVVSSENFSDEVLAKHITYARKNTSDTVRDIEISTNDYYPDDHDSTVRKVLNMNEEGFEVKVSNFLPDFRSLSDG